MTGDRSKLRCCKEQYCIGTWDVKSMNQGKLEVVKQEMARVNVNILRISELKWTEMGEFNSDDHYNYYCGQESLRRNGVAIMVNKRVWNALSYTTQSHRPYILSLNINSPLLSPNFSTRGGRLKKTRKGEGWGACGETLLGPFCQFCFPFLSSPSSPGLVPTSKPPPLSRASVLPTPLSTLDPRDIGITLFFIQDLSSF